MAESLRANSSFFSFNAFSAGLRQAVRGIPMQQVAIVIENIVQESHIRDHNGCRRLPSRLLVSIISAPGSLGIYGSRSPPWSGSRSLLGIGSGSTCGKRRTATQQHGPLLLCFFVRCARRTDGQGAPTQTAQPRNPCRKNLRHFLRERLE